MQALIVEDDADIAELIEHYLRLDGWDTETIADGRAALDQLRRQRYDLLLLDVELPRTDGLTILAEVRRERSSREMAVVMITARGLEADRVGGLEQGADDYVVKPFSPKELMARIRAVRRRMEPAAASETVTLGPLTVDTARHLATWQGAPARLTPKEFGLLLALLEARGRVLSRQQLLEAVWGYSYAEGTRTVDVHVRRLREKLPGLSAWLQTVTAVGYRLAAPESP